LGTSFLTRRLVAAPVGASSGPARRPETLISSRRPRWARWAAVALVAGLAGTGTFVTPLGTHVLALGAAGEPATPQRIAHPLLRSGEFQHALLDLTAGINGGTRAPVTVCAALRTPVPGLCGTPPEAARSAPLTGGSGWGLTGPSPPPQQPTAFEITYDAWDQYVLLFGMVPDDNASGGVSDTWAYQGSNWTEIPTSGSPVACTGSSLAYDSEDGYVVFVGGMYVGFSNSPCPSAGQTWTYRSGTWTELTPTTSPPTRSYASFADDTGDGYMVLFGGDTMSYPRGDNDTWKFAGGSWTELTPATAPSERSQAGLAYDAKDGYLLLFGGMSSYLALNDTWNFSKGNWTQLFPTNSPPVPQPDAFSYDAADQEILYTTAYSWNATNLETLWAFAGGDWSAVNFTSGPVQRLDAATTYDARDGYLLLFGGVGVSPLADTWTFVSGSWLNRTAPTPPPRANAASAYDAADGYEVLFGGSQCPTPSSSTCPALGDTWVFTRSWINLTPNPSPPARERAGLVYDAADGYILLFGGDANGKALNDTWKFLAGTWTELTPATAPSNRTAGTMVYDAADRYVLLFGGDAALTYPYAGDYRDTWTYAGGVWTNRTGSISVAPPAEATNRMVYDASDGYVLLFGTFAGTELGIYSDPWSLAQNQTWSYSGGAWTNLTASAGPAPPPRTDAAVAYDLADRSVVLFGGTSTPFSWWGDTWSFAQGSWSRLPTSDAPFNRSGASFEYDPLLAGGLLIGGTSGYTPTDFQDPSCQSFAGDMCPDLWVWGGSSTVSGPLTIGNFRAAAPILDLGLTAQLTTTVSGGAPPYYYTYAGLPAGCASANVSTLDCVPTVIGTFVVNVSVHDSGTNASFGSLLLEIVPDPSVTSFAAAPATVTVGNRTTFAAQLVGGVAPFSISYTGLPAACAPVSSLTMDCTPEAAGSFSVQITVLDSEGLRSQSTTNLVVEAAGSVGPSIAGFSAAPSTIVLGNSTTLTVTLGANAGTVTYGYTGLPPGCATNNTPSLACSPTAAGVFQVELTATATNGSSTVVMTTVAVEPLGGGLDPLVTAFGAAPNPVREGQTTVLSLVASGGSGALTIRYNGLPPGCPSADLVELPCAPSAAGTYLIEAVVDDAGGHFTGALTQLTVLLSPSVVAPTVTAFYPNPSKITLGESTLFLVTATGGASPLRFAYTTLPPGCESANTPSLPCSPGTTGEFRVGVNVTDAAGGSVNATTVLTVGPATGSNASSSGTPLNPYVLVGVILLGVAGAVALTVALIVRRAQRPPATPPRPKP
jgi:galactose oxidase-like protein